MYPPFSTNRVLSFASTIPLAAAKKNWCASHFQRTLNFWIQVEDG